LFQGAVIPPDIYKGVNLPTVTIGVGVLLVISAKVDDDTAYGIARALWHKNTRGVFDNGPPEAKRIRVENAVAGVPIPLHPGAERYYREYKVIE
jgi:TRAP transporter TAXI family solute receptor